MQTGCWLNFSLTVCRWEQKKWSVQRVQRLNKRVEIERPKGEWPQKLSSQLTAAWKCHQKMLKVWIYSAADFDNHTEHHAFFFSTHWQVAWPATSSLWDFLNLLHSIILVGNLFLFVNCIWPENLMDWLSLIFAAVLIDSSFTNQLWKQTSECTWILRTEIITTYLLRTKSEAEHQQQPPLCCINVI